MSAKPSPPHRVTMADIARAARVHKSTVSLALRNQPSIPVATRERIRKLAAKLGYRPDPVLAAFNSHRLLRASTPSRHRCSIAFVSDLPDAPAFARSTRHRELFAGAKAQAEKLGAHLERFLVGPASGQLSPARLDRVLRARGISAVIVGAFTARTSALPLSWADLCAVAIESAHVEPPLDVVAANHREAARLAVQTLRSAGARRIGFALNAALGLPACIEEQLRAGHLVEHAALAPRGAAAIPFLSVAPDDVAALSRWVRDERLDAVVHCALPPRPDLRVPACASIDLDAPQSTVAGVPTLHRELGRRAVEMLILRQRSNLPGLPARRSTTLLPVTWREAPVVAPPPAVARPA